MHRLLALSVAALLALAGCGDTATVNEPTSEECKKASKRLLRAIETGLTVSGSTKGRLRNGYIVRSEDFKKVYMVAADIQADGLEGDGDIGVWATNSAAADGMIFAINGVAQEFSDWGPGDTTDANIDRTADGVAQVEECAGG